MAGRCLSFVKHVTVAAAVIAGVLVAACDDAEEALPEATATSTLAVATASTTAAGTPPPTSAPAPTDWQTYQDPEGRFTIQYPADWYDTSGQAQFSSHDIEALTSPQRPPESVIIEVSFNDARGSDTCAGTLSIDPGTGEIQGPLNEAMPTSLDGVDAWEVIKEAEDLEKDEGLTRVHRVATVVDASCVFITAYYTQEDPDAELFNRIVDSFQFGQ